MDTKVSPACMYAFADCCSGALLAVSHPGIKSIGEHPSLQLDRVNALSDNS
jgi:hypothetical protein